MYVIWLSNVLLSFCQVVNLLSFVLLSVILLIFNRTSVILRVVILMSVSLWSGIQWHVNLMNIILLMSVCQVSIR
jgi:hypothetical protein